jgi:hypothetical protein
MAHHVRIKPEAPEVDYLTTVAPGSKSKAIDGATGGGSVTYHYGHRIDRKAFSLGRNAEVFDAEASAALRGAKAALLAPTAKLAIDI